MADNHSEGGVPGDERERQRGEQGGNQPPGGPGGQQSTNGGQKPGHPPGEAAAGQPRAGGQDLRRRPTAGDRLQAAFGEYAVKQQLKAVVGTWALIGLGLGLTPVLLIGLLGPSGAIASFGAATAFGTGPVIGGLIGLSLANKLPVDVVPGAIVSGVTNVLGFVVMALVFAILLTLQGGGAAGTAGGQLGDLIAPLILTAIPVGITAGAVTALGRKVDFPASRDEAADQEPPAPRAPRRGAQQAQQP